MSCSRILNEDFLFFLHKIKMTTTVNVKKLIAFYENKSFIHVEAEALVNHVDNKIEEIVKKSTRSPSPPVTTLTISHNFIVDEECNTT